mmetsp:Transcript_17881/g.51460  ORF Transcript_17881/g.51460 Transcript_17881/m.51460 type:complete len:365 (+) Transcript_17881:772-1866(+)
MPRILLNAALLLLGEALLLLSPALLLRSEPLLLLAPQPLLLEPPLLRSEGLPLLALLLLLSEAALLGAPQLGLAACRLLGGARPRPGDPRPQAHVQQHGHVQRPCEARLPAGADLPPLALHEAHGMDNSNKAATSGQPPSLQPRPRRLKRSRQFRRRKRRHGQSLGSAPHIDLRDEPREVVAEAYRVSRAHPTLSDDASHNLVELLCLRHRAFRSHALQRAELARLEEEPRHAESPLLLRHVEGEHERLDEGTHAEALEAGGEQVPEACDDLVEGAPVRVAIVHDLHQLDGAALRDLIQDKLALEHVRFLRPVGLEATNVVQVAGAERVEERLEIFAVLFRDALEQRRPRAEGLLVAEGLHQRI